MNSEPAAMLQWSLRYVGRSKHAVYRDKERRRERLRANLVAKTRR